MLHHSKHLFVLAPLAAGALLSCGWPSGLGAVNPSFSVRPVGIWSTGSLMGGAVPDSSAVVPDPMPLPADEGEGSDEWAPGKEGAMRSGATTGSQVIDLDAFGLAVPFRTQKDGSIYAGANCGPAALGMVLDAFGISGATNDDLRYATHAYQGTLGRRGGTALQHMARVAEDHGLVALGLYDGDDFAAWSVSDVERALRAGRPVIALVKYRALPGNEGSPVRYDHYIVLYGVHGGGLVYHDPAQPTVAKGAGRWISGERLELAMRSASVPGQAVAFDGGSLTSLEVVPLAGASSRSSSPTW